MACIGVTEPGPASRYKICTRRGLPAGPSMRSSTTQEGTVTTHGQFCPVSKAMQWAAWMGKAVPRRIGQSSFAAVPRPAATVG
jgi:hypothetical protein